jgi:hypothetical protein
MCPVQGTSSSHTLAVPWHSELYWEVTCWHSHPVVLFFEQETGAAGPLLPGGMSALDPSKFSSQGTATPRISPWSP